MVSIRKNPLAALHKGTYCQEVKKRIFCCFGCPMQFKIPIHSVLMFTKGVVLTHCLQQQITLTHTHRAVHQELLGIPKVLALDALDDGARVFVYIFWLKTFSFFQNVLVWILNSISVHLINCQVSYLNNFCQNSSFHCCESSDNSLYELLYVTELLQAITDWKWHSKKKCWFTTQLWGNK